MAFIIDYYRAKLIKQDYRDSKKLPNQSVIQSTGKLPMIKAPRDEFGQIGGCDIYMVDLSKVPGGKVPKVIDTDSLSLWTFVGTPGSIHSFHKTTKSALPFNKKSTITGRSPKWFELGDNIYVASHQPIREIVLQGVFERPIEVVELKGKLDPFDRLDFSYPLGATMIDTINKLIADADLKLLALPQDTTNNGVATPVSND